MKHTLTLQRLTIALLLLVLVLPTRGQEGGSAASMSLQEAIDYAIDNSYDMAYADMDVRAASRRNRELTAIGLPQINGDISFTNYLELPTTLIPSNAFNPMAPEGEFEELQFGTEYNATATLAASQLLFDGTYFIGLKAAKTFIQLNKQAEKQTENEVRQAITEAYGLAVLAVRAHNILNENYESLSQLLFETEKLYENGFREELDVDQLRLQLASLGNNRRQAERNVTVTQNLLKFQMGMPVANELVLTSTLEEMASASNVPQMLEKEVNLDNHIDIRTNETNVELRQLNVRVERMAGAPKLGASFTAQEQAFRNDVDFFGDGSSWFPNVFWGLQLQIPIFSGFQRYNKVQQAKIDHERAQRQLDQVRESIKLQVATEKANFASALDVYQTEEENLALAERINTITRKKYEEGLATSFDLQQAESQLLNAQRNYLQSAHEVIKSRAALEKALDIQ